MPAITVHHYASEIQACVRQLKVERDTWQAVAMEYKSAFESQTSRLQELQGICFAAQAELENERAEIRRRQATWERTTRLNTMDGADEPRHAQTFGMATVFHQHQTSDMCTNPLFHSVQRCIDERNYGTALVEIERLLRGPLSPKARAEGLLLKSSVLRAAGPEELLDALAACSEALELCDRISDLENFLPRIQYQRGVLFYQLRMLHQARDAFGAVNNDDLLSATAHEYRSSCDEEIRLHNAGNRRSGFDENRSFDEGLLVQLDEKLDTKRRRSSAQLRLRAAVKSKRMSIPHLWTSGKSDAS